MQGFEGQVGEKGGGGWGGYGGPDCKSSRTELSSRDPRSPRPLICKDNRSDLLLMCPKGPGSPRQAGVRLRFSLTILTGPHLFPATPCWAGTGVRRELFTCVPGQRRGDTSRGAALSSTHRKKVMAVGWRKGRGRQFGPADGVPTGEDTPRCFSRRGLRAKHGGGSALCVGGNSCCLVFSSHVRVTPAGTARDGCLQGQGSDASRTKDLPPPPSPLTFLLSLFASGSAKVACECTSASLILGEDRFHPEARVCFTDFLLAAADQNLSLL